MATEQSNQPNTPITNSFLGDLRSIYGSWPNTFRALVLLAGIAFIVQFVINGIWGKNVQVEINKERTIIVRGETKDDVNGEVAILLLPSTICWHNSGVVLKPHQTATITASGEIHLGIDKIIDAAHNHSLPRYGWNGPEGADFVSPDPNTPGRISLLIDRSFPKAKIGNIIACIVPRNPKKTEIPTIYNPRPDTHIFDLSVNREITNESEKEGVIYLTVNDLVLNKDAKELFLGIKPTKTGSTSDFKKWDTDYKNWAKNWESVSRNMDWDLYFKDNVGNFLVQIQKKSL